VAPAASMSTNGRRAAVKNVAAAASASTSGRGADVNNVVAAAYASTSGRGAGVNNHPGGSSICSTSGSIPVSCCCAF